MKNIALIPARSGSKRVKDKNIVELNGKPLIAYTIESALQSGVYKDVYVITDSKKYAKISEKYGAIIPAIRPNNISGENSPDIDWVKWIFGVFENKNISFDTFSILRPTSPFRTLSTYQRAFKLFYKNVGAHSLRAVEEVNQHPGKMWTIKNNNLLPLLPFDIEGVPWHSNQKSKLPKIYVQNASFEIAWTSTVDKLNSISGSNIIPFVTKKHEGFDINEPEDIILAKQIIKKLWEI